MESPYSETRLAIGQRYEPQALSLAAASAADVHHQQPPKRSLAPYTVASMVTQKSE